MRATGYQRDQPGFVGQPGRPDDLTARDVQERSTDIVERDTGEPRPGQPVRRKLQRRRALVSRPQPGFVVDDVVQIAVAYVLFVRGLKHVTATQASLTGMLEPVSNPIWVLLFLGEKPSAFAIAGAVVVLSAIAWHTLRGEPATELPAPD